MEYESFIDDIKNINGVLRVTIPYRVAQVMGLKEEDRVRVMVKKIVEE